jgi:hypothetical protein
MSKRKVIVIVALLLGIVAAASFFNVYSTTAYSCLECRATLTKRRICGVPFQWAEQNSYSQAVISSSPAAHQHQWRWCGTTLSYSLTSFARSCGRQHSIWHLPIPIQAEYSHLVPASELHEMLQAIDSPDRKVAEATVNRVYERVLDSR